MDQLIHNIGHAMMRQRAIEEDDFEVFCYGVDLIFSTLVNAVFILGISIVLGVFPESLLLYCVFSLLQTTGGGFHATTHFRCFCVTTTGWAVGMILMHRIGFPLLALLAVWGMVCVFAFAPIEHENAPIGKEKKQKMKMIARVLACLTAIASFVMYRYHIALYIPLLTALGMVGCSMTAAIVQKYARNP